MTEFILSPQVIKEATSYIPFKNVTDQDTLTFEETAMFTGVTVKPDQTGKQTIVEVNMQVGEASANGNENVKFRTDVWLNNAICAGTIRSKDAEERDWKGTKAALRTLSNLAAALGIKTDNPVTALAEAAVPAGPVHVRIRVYRATSGQYKWELNRVSKVAA